MPTITADEAQQRFDEFLDRTAAGETFIIMKDGRPIATMQAPWPADMTPERRAAVERAVAMMEEGLPQGETAGPFTRDEMHER